MALVLTMCLSACDAMATEICGLQNAVYDGIFVDGFNEPSSTGLGPAYGTVIAPATGITPSVAITSPTIGSSIAGGHVQITGTVSGPPNVGVAVNGQRAYVYNGTFLTPVLTLDPSATQVSVVATAPDGLSATATAAVSVAAAEPDATLDADAVVGFAPLPVRFTVRLRDGLVPTVSSVSLDFTTDGTPDYTGAGPIPSNTFGAAGIYTATATVTLSDSTTRVATRKVVALDLAERRLDVCSVYANLRAGLMAQDANGAARSLTGPLHAKLLALFNALGVKMSVVAAGLGTLADGTLGLDTADLVAVKDAAGTLRGYPVHMVRDAQGVWRIDAM